MTIFSETIVNGQSAAARHEDTAHGTLRISDSPVDLLRGPQLLYPLGSFATDDNIPKDLQAFKRDLLEQKPHLNKWLELVSPYVDLELLKGMLAGGLESMIPGYFRSAHLLMQNAEQHAQVHLVSYPAVEEIMKQYPVIDARPDSFYSDHSYSVTARVFGPYIASNLCCIKQKDGTWQAAGKKRNVEEVLKATQNLSLMGNSFGTSFTVQMENALGQILRQLEYSPMQAHIIMSSVRAFGFSSVSPFAVLNDSGQSFPRFTMTAVQGINDVIAETLCRHKAFPTMEEIRRCVPADEQQDVRTAIARYREEVKERLSRPGAEPYLPSKNPDDIENMEFLILRKVAPNRILILTPVPTFAQRWAFEVPGKNTQRYLDDLHHVLDGFAATPADRNQQAYRTSYAKKYDMFINVMQQGGNANASAQALLQAVPSANRAQLEAALERLASQSKQFDGFMAILTQDRAGHNISFYQLQHERLLRLSKRVVANMLRYNDLGEQAKKTYRVEDMLARVPGRVPDMFHPHTAHPLDVLLDRDTVPQMDYLARAAGHGR